MSRRLVNRSGAAAASSSSSTSTATTTLPPYEPLAFPLNEPARRGLGDLSNARGTAQYEKHLGDAVRHIGASVGDLHERLRNRRQRLNLLRERREERGTDVTAEEERLEEHVATLQEQVDGLTKRSEVAVREVIDRRAEMEDEASVLQDLYTKAAGESANHNSHGTGRATRGRPDGPVNASQDNADAAAADHADEDGDKEMPPPVQSTLESYQHDRAAKQAAYEQLSMHERYALNNDYAGFKKLWHDAAVGEDGPPLPDASRWFRSDGRPVMTIAGDGGGGGAAAGRGDEEGDEDEAMSDDDVAVARENISLKCPLTLMLMEEPYSNRKCKHTFERAAIVEYLSRQNALQCPQTGCSQTFSKKDFKQDFYLDHAILRRIQRAKQAQEDHHMDDFDDDDEEGDEAVNERSIVEGHARTVRKPKQER